MSGLTPQKRARRIAMSDSERDEFLVEQRMCRVATTGPDGPHATPLWFVWDGTSVWLYSLVRSRRWADLTRDPRIGVVVDTGEQYAELRGVEITGTAEPVGDVPRAGGPDASVEAAEQLMADKYFAGSMGFDAKHAWLRVVPTKIVSWDFRKLAPLGP